MNSCATNPTGAPQCLGAPEHTTVSSPLGELTLVRRDDELVGLYFRHHRPAPPTSRLGVANPTGFEAFVEELEEYFSGVRQGFDVPIRAIGTSADQQVWECAAAIRHGQTSTYGRIARELGGGISAQEVGAALARNPLCIVIPCHRVVGADGSLTGYAGGLHRKRYLLDLEQEASGEIPRLF